MALDNFLVIVFYCRSISSGEGAKRNSIWSVRDETFYSLFDYNRGYMTANLYEGMEPGESFSSNGSCDSLMTTIASSRGNWTVEKRRATSTLPKEDLREVLSSEWPTCGRSTGCLVGQIY